MHTFDPHYFVQPGMGAKICNPSTRKKKQEDQELRASISYTNTKQAQDQLFKQQQQKKKRQGSSGACL